MIAIASDKFKGTLSSTEAGEAIRLGLGELCGREIRVFAMADGGEGTAQALGAVAVPQAYYTFRGADGSMKAYIPSCGEGMPWQTDISGAEQPLRQRSSFEVGRAVRRAAESGLYSGIYVGIGGTRTADGGLGMLRGMGYTIECDSDRLPTAVIPPTALAPVYAATVCGLADVGAPLYADAGLSAMSFLAQKGATEADVQWCEALFRRLMCLYPAPAPFGGAGGGIGFALGNIAGCECRLGAPVILETALQNSTPELLITGEGHLDAQTLGGKTVAAVYARAHACGIPAAAFCGSMAAGVGLPNVFPCISDGDPIPADPVATLRHTAVMARPYIEKLLLNHLTK